ncbi:MAG: GreA/GreB family elongation factor [Clostridiales bacterium]|nr:GreA/GreB family elongation factor [Clostridiales bacterium]
MPKEYIMTAAGKRELEERYDYIRSVELPAIIEEVAKARAQGDLSENAEYGFAREKQAQLQSELDAIKEKIDNAKIIDEKSVSDKAVSIGCAVDVIEADIAEGLTACEEAGLTRTDIIEGFISRMSVIDMRSNRTGLEILSSLTAEDYKTAGSEILAKRGNKAELVEKGFTEAELVKVKVGKEKIDKAKCSGLKTYTIVGTHESDVMNGKISNESLVGAALMDKKVGDVVMVKDLIFKVVNIVVDKKTIKK